MNNHRVHALLSLLLAGLVFISLSLVLLKPVGDPDFFWHIATGRWIAENLTLPEKDPFAYTTPALMSSREHFILTSYWLSQIFYYAVYYVSGWKGFIILRFLTAALLFCIIYKRAKTSDNRLIPLGLTAITMIVFSQMYDFERPQVFSFLFFAMLIHILEKKLKADDMASGRSSLFSFTPLPLLMLFWSNMHGGYMLGQAVILLYILAEGLKFSHPSLKPMGKSAYSSFLMLGLSGLLASLINPNTYKAALEMMSLPEHIKTFIIEYQSTLAVFSKYHKAYIPVYWALLLTASLLMLYRVKKKVFDWKDIILLAGLGFFSFTQQRYVAFFLIWAAPFISVSLSGMNKHRTKYISYACFAFSLLITLYLVTTQGEFKNLKNMERFKTDAWLSREYPEDAVRFIMKNNIRGNMYNYYDWGGYLIWMFYPAKKVFIDGRGLYIYLYSQSSIIDHAVLNPEIMGTPLYRATLESYNIRYILTPLFGISGYLLPVVRELANDSDWAAVFLAENSIIFVKNTPENHDVILRHSIPDFMIKKSLKPYLGG